VDLQKLSLNSIHKNGEDEYEVEERMDEGETIYVKFRKAVVAPAEDELIPEK
jgi:hypothetical protein